MKIEHLAIYVSDLEKSKEFFEKYFGGKSGEKYHNQNTGFSSYFIRFSDGARLEIMTKPDRFKDDKDNHRLGFVHLAFAVGSKDNVDALTSNLKKDGFKTVSGPRITGDGYYESCVQGPNEILLEITV